MTSFMNELKELAIDTGLICLKRNENVGGLYIVFAGKFHDDRIGK